MIPSCSSWNLTVRNAGLELRMLHKFREARIDQAENIDSELNGLAQTTLQIVTKKNAMLNQRLVLSELCLLKLRYFTLFTIH